MSVVRRSSPAGVWKQKKKKKKWRRISGRRRQAARHGGSLGNAGGAAAHTAGWRAMAHAAARAARPGHHLGAVEEGRAPETPHDAGAGLADHHPAGRGAAHPHHRYACVHVHACRKWPGAAAGEWRGRRARPRAAGARGYAACGDISDDGEPTRMMMMMMRTKMMTMMMIQMDTQMTKARDEERLRNDD